MQRLWGLVAAMTLIVSLGYRSGLGASGGGRVHAMAASFDSHSGLAMMVARCMNFAELEVDRLGLGHQR